MNECDDWMTARALAEQLRLKNPDRTYTITAGIDKPFAVRDMTPWDSGFLAWRRNYYLTMGWRA